MKNLLLLLIITTQFSVNAQVKSNEVSKYDLAELEYKLDEYIKLKNNASYFKVAGLGLMGASFISIFSLNNQLKEIDYDLENDKFKKTSDKINNSYLLAGLGTIISSIGVVIPLSFKKDKTTSIPSIREFDPKSYELNRSLGPINLKNVKSMFREGDSISVKTINGPVILNGILKTIAVNRIEIESNSRLFKFYLNQIEFIKR